MFAKRKPRLVRWDVPLSNGEVIHCVDIERNAPSQHFIEPDDFAPLNAHTSISQTRSNAGEVLWLAGYYGILLYCISLSVTIDIEPLKLLFNINDMTFISHWIERTAGTLNFVGAFSFPVTALGIILYRPRLSEILRIWAKIGAAVVAAVFYSVFMLIVTVIFSFGFLQLWTFYMLLLFTWLIIMPSLMFFADRAAADEFGYLWYKEQSYRERGLIYRGEETPPQGRETTLAHSKFADRPHSKISDTEI